MAPSLKQLTELPNIWATEDKALVTAADKLVDITSGGLQEIKRDSDPPCLCLTEDMALDFWEIAARRYFLGLPSGCHYKWIERPTLDKWLMTATDQHNSHRVVTTRYTVYSRLMVATV